MKGARGIRLFFSSQSILDAIIVTLDPDMFAAVMDELDGRYDLVKKNLMGEDFTDDCTHVLWEKDNIYIELQKPVPILCGCSMSKKCCMKIIKIFCLNPMKVFGDRK